MTVREKMEDLLVNHGLWPNEAKVVLADEESHNDSMRGRWDEDESAYPTSLMRVLWLVVRRRAVEHLEATKPKHFALMLLKGDD